MNLKEEQLSFLPNRIAIIGTSGSGKTQFGLHIASVFVIKCVDLDELNWLPGWKQRENDEFIKLINKEIKNDRWVVCGNYSRARQHIWSRADMIIWLDQPFSTCLWRAFKRSIRRLFMRIKCCNGNYETIGRILGKDSILVWIWHTYSRRKKSYEDYFASSENSKSLVRLTNDKEIKNLLNHFSFLNSRRQPHEHE